MSDDEYYQNILDKYQKYRKSGLSTSLAKRLQKRKLRKARHHRKRHNSTRYSKYFYCCFFQWVEKNYIKDKNHGLTEAI